MSKHAGVVFAALALSLGLAVASVPASAEGDPAKGKREFNKCRACHSLEAGKKRIGPSLHGMFGRTAGTLEGFNFSPDMKAAGQKGLAWTDETFVKYMADPKRFIGSYIGKDRATTRMAFAGLRRESQRADLLAYLKEATK